MSVATAELNKEKLDKEYIVHGEFGHETLGARFMKLDIGTLRDLWALHTRHDTFFSDHVQKSFTNFSLYFTRRVDLLTEVVELPSERHIGIMYFTDTVRSETEKQIVDTFGHFSFWDGKVGKRRELIRRVMKIYSDSFNIHRISVRIPEYAIGAINIAGKLGFGGNYVHYLRDKKKVFVEGVLRSAVKYQGEWHDELLMSVLRSEL